MTLILKAALTATASLSIAAGCTACPKISVAKDAERWVFDFAGDSKVEARISEPKIECVIKGRTAIAKVMFTMTGNRLGEVAPVFVAVANMIQGAPVLQSKDVYSKTLVNGARLVVFDQITIPVGARGLASDYEVLIGFDLGESQVSAMSKWKSWFARAF